MVQNKQESRCKYWETRSSFFYSLALLIHSIAPYCLLPTACFVLLALHCSFCTFRFAGVLSCTHSFAHSLTPDTCGIEVFVHDMNASISYSINPLWEDLSKDGLHQTFKRGEDLQKRRGSRWGGRKSLGETLRGDIRKRGKERRKEIRKVAG